MLITEYADIIDKILVIRYYPNKEKNKFIAQFEHGEIMINGMLLGEFCCGETPIEALRNYAKCISGKRICFNAYETKNRQEFNVPKNIMY